MLWRNIPGYKYPYRISDKGEVQKYEQETKKWIPLKATMSKGVWWTVYLRKTDGKIRRVGVSRLMDQAFFGGYAAKHNLKIVHRNGVKSDCSRGNLEFLTQSQIGKRHGSRGRKKTVVEYDRWGKSVAVYPSIGAAAKAHGMGRNAMANRIYGVTLDPSGAFYKFEGR